MEVKVKVKEKVSYWVDQIYPKLVQYLGLFKLLLKAASLDVGDKELVLNVDVVLGLLNGGHQRPLDAELSEVLPCRPAGTTSHHL